MVDSCLIQGSVVILLHMSTHDACVVRVVICLGGVSIFYDRLVYVSIHVYAAGSLGVLVIIIPCKVYSCGFFSFLFGYYLVVLLQDLEEM